MRTSLWRIKEGGRGWGWVDSTVSRFEKTFIRQNCATTLGNAIDFFVSPRFPPLRGVLLACSRSRARRGAARKEDRICEMAVHEGWISDEVIRGGWSGPPCRGRGKSCKGEKFEVNSIEIGGSTIYFVTGLTSCHPFPFDSMHVRNDSPRCARLFRRETTGWVVFTFMDIIMRSFVRIFSFFFVEDITGSVTGCDSWRSVLYQSRERKGDCMNVENVTLLRVYRVSYFYLHVDFYTLYRFL